MGKVRDRWRKGGRWREEGREREREGKGQGERERERVRREEGGEVEEDIEGQRERESELILNQVAVNDPLSPCLHLRHVRDVLNFTHGQRIIYNISMAFLIFIIFY